MTNVLDQGSKGGWAPLILPFVVAERSDGAIGSGQ
jgi:hypothetical protein